MICCTAVHCKGLSRGEEKKGSLAVFEWEVSISLVSERSKYLAESSTNGSSQSIV